MPNCALFLTTNGLIAEKDYPYTSGTTKIAGVCQQSGKPVKKLLTGSGYQWVVNDYTAASFK